MKAGAEFCFQRPELVQGNPEVTYETMARKEERPNQSSTTGNEGKISQPAGLRCSRRLRSDGKGGRGQGCPCSWHYLLEHKSLRGHTEKTKLGCGENQALN
jgi:hypothetical protein